MLRKLRDAIFERRDDIANIVVRETGKPRAEAILAEVLLALDTADFLARQAPRWLRLAARPAPQHRAEGEIRLARIRAAWRRSNLRLLGPGIFPSRFR